MNVDLVTDQASDSALTSIASIAVTVNENQPSVSGGNSEQSATVALFSDNVPNPAMYSLPTNLTTTQNSYLNPNVSTLSD